MPSPRHRTPGRDKEGLPLFVTKKCYTSSRFRQLSILNGLRTIPGKNHCDQVTENKPLFSSFKLAMRPLSQLIGDIP